MISVTRGDELKNSGQRILNAPGAVPKVINSDNIYINNQRWEY